ncbi:hypothetical protein ACNOYE_13545 [Nannocystaceae bacterium ST9]
MKRQAFLLLCALSFAPGCVLDIEVLDGVGDDYGDSEESSSDADAESSTTDPAETSTSTSESSTTDAESSTSTTDDPAESSTTDAESDSSSSTTDATTETSTTATDNPGESSTSDAPADCVEIELEYEAIVGMTECVTDSDCKVIDGHCGVGLGGCYYTVNTNVDESVLDELAQLWSGGGCTEGVCDCGPSPDFAVCEAGTCVAG